MDDFQPDDFQSDDFQPDNLEHPASNKGFFNQAKGAFDVYKQNPAFSTSPQNMLQEGYGLLQKGANKAGEYITDALSQSFSRPNATAMPESWRAPVAAGVGTMVSMTPDIISSFSPQESKIISDSVSSPFFQDKAQNLGAKALGFSKKFLADPSKADRAKKVAQAMLDEGVLTPLSSSKEMAIKAQELADNSGKAIGDYLEKMSQQGNFFDQNVAISELEKLRPARQSGSILKGGAFEKINQKIDNAINTIRAYGDQPISWQEANDLKGYLQDLANWNNNKESTVLDKVIAGKFRESLDNSLENFSQNPGQDPAAFEEFLKNKKNYSAALSAMDPLYNRISSELGNKSIGLTDFILAAPDIATGNFGKAAALVGGKRIFEKFGPQTGATLFNKLSKASQKVEGISPSGSNLLSNEIQSSSERPLFNKNPKFLKAAQNKKDQDSQNNIKWAVVQPNDSEARPVDLSVPKKVAKTVPKYLDEETARMYLDKANGNKAKARALAKQDGYTVV